MEAKENNEALKLTKVISSLELPLSKRVELVDVITSYALRERQEGYLDGLKEVVGMLEKRRGEPNGHKEI